MRAVCSRSRALYKQSLGLWNTLHWPDESMHYSWSSPAKQMTEEDIQRKQFYLCRGTTLNKHATSASGWKASLHSHVPLWEPSAIQGLSLAELCSQECAASQLLPWPFRAHGAAVCLCATSRLESNITRIFFLKENCSLKYKAMPLWDSVPKRFNQRWAGVSFHNRNAVLARYRLLLSHAKSTLAGNVYGWKFQAMWKQVCSHLYQTHTSRHNTFISKVQTLCLYIELPYTRHTKGETQELCSMRSLVTWVILLVHNQGTRLSWKITWENSWQHCPWPVTRHHW